MACATKYIYSRVSSLTTFVCKFIRKTSMMLLRSFLFLVLFGMSFGHVFRAQQRRSRNATIEDRPWHVSVGYVNDVADANATPSHLCSGTIIGPQLIATAAYMITRVGGVLPDALFYVRVGSNNAESGGQLIAVDRIIVHPQLNETTLENDIALLYLPVPLNFSDSVNAIALPDADAERLPADSNVTMSGWRIKHVLDEDIMMRVVLPGIHIVDQVIWDQDACKNVHRNVTEVVGDNNICAASRIINGGECSVRHKTSNILMIYEFSLISFSSNFYSGKFWISIGSCS